MNTGYTDVRSNAPSPEFARGAQWPAMIVKVSGFSNVSVIPKFLWTELDVMERRLLASGLREAREPQNSRAYVALLGDRPMRVIVLCKKGIRFDVFSIDTMETRNVQELYELPEEFSPDNVPSFSKRVSLCSDHRVDRMDFLKFRTLLENTCPFVDVFVTKGGNPTDSGNTPEVLFLDEFCRDLIESRGLSGALDWKEDDSNTQ